MHGTCRGVPGTGWSGCPRGSILTRWRLTTATAGTKRPDTADKSRPRHELGQVFGGSRPGVTHPTAAGTPGVHLPGESGVLSVSVGRRCAAAARGVAF